MKQMDYSKPISLKNIRVVDSFWKKEMELVRTEVIPYQWEALNDRVKGALPSYCMRNFKLAGQLTKERKEKQTKDIETRFPTNIIETLPEDKNHLENRFYGFVFQDSDFAKWIEAVGYSLTQHPDIELERIADEAIEVVCQAQQPNGYLNTHYIINDLEKAFTNLRNNHELYCFGHLVEGAVAYYEATGKDSLLKATERYGDYIISLFGEEDGKLKGYPGHQIAEMALIRLYEVTNKDQYLELSKYFIEERGKKPYYFNKEDGIEPIEDSVLPFEYYQAHLPVREQNEAVGHAVRAVYMYSGMADIARITEDENLLKSCQVLWDNIINEKMYVTGGIGGTHIGESFSFPYDLPNDTAYAETCASIGLVFFARRMLMIKPEARYANIMERALYNGILSGIGLDGKSYFYVNPLEVVPQACNKDERKFHVKPVRQKWFGCACCPPNLARLISSIGSYAFTETQDTLFVHLYMGSEIVKTVDGQSVHIQVESAFPWEGRVTVKVTVTEPTKLRLAFRIPDWCKEYNIEAPQGETECKEGYYYLNREWNQEETIILDFPMEIRRIKANPLVRENIGKVSLMRGPVVYCMEEADNGDNLHLISLPNETTFTSHTDTILKEPIVAIKGNGKRIKLSDKGTGELYTEAIQEEQEEIEVTWIPYYTWANRQEGEMQVWVRESI